MTDGSTASTSSAPLVLIIDDHRDTLDLYAEYFRFRGLRVEGATDGQEGLEKIHALRPDVVVSDLSMPKLDGWQLCRQVRADPVTRSIRIVALTGHALRGLPEPQVTDCDAYVVKPCLPQDLYDVVLRVLPALA